MKRGLNSLKALNGREVALGPKVEDEFVKHILSHQRIAWHTSSN
jgi:hypothetical protein